MPHMRYVRKAVVVAVGLGLIMLTRHAGLDLMDFKPAAVDVVLAILTAVGVYAVPNDTPQSSA